MVSAAFAQKLGMTHLYDDKNRHVAVTILKVTDQVVTGKRTQDKDGYTAIQFGSIGSKHIAKPQAAELKKNNIDLVIDHRAEVEFAQEDDQNQVNIGDKITVSTFTAGDEVEVSGVSKGKGFSGTIKRYGWSRGPETHGSKNVRKPGSIGSGYPQRVVPGKKLPGHMGHESVTTRGLKVVAINEKDSTIAISGAIPGANRSFVIIRKGKKARG